MKDHFPSRNMDFLEKHPFLKWLFGAMDAATGDPDRQLIYIGIVIALIFVVVILCFPLCLGSPESSLEEDPTGNSGGYDI